MLIVNSTDAELTGYNVLEIGRWEDGRYYLRVPTESSLDPAMLVFTNNRTIPIDGIDIGIPGNSEAIIQPFLEGDVGDTFGSAEGSTKLELGELGFKCIGTYIEAVDNPEDPEDRSLDVRYVILQPITDIMSQSSSGGMADSWYTNVNMGIEPAGWFSPGVGDTSSDKEPDDTGYIGRMYHDFNDYPSVLSMWRLCGFHRISVLRVWTDNRLKYGEYCLIPLFTLEYEPCPYTDEEDPEAEYYAPGMKPYFPSGIPEERCFPLCVEVAGYYGGEVSWTVGYVSSGYFGTYYGGTFTPGQGAYTGAGGFTDPRLSRKFPTRVPIYKGHIPTRSSGVVDDEGYGPITDIAIPTLTMNGYAYPVGGVYPRLDNYAGSPRYRRYDNVFDIWRPSPTSKWRLTFAGDVNATEYFESRDLRISNQNIDSFYTPCWSKVGGSALGAMRSRAKRIVTLNTAHNWGAGGVEGIILEHELLSVVAVCTEPGTWDETGYHDWEWINDTKPAPMHVILEGEQPLAPEIKYSSPQSPYSVSGAGLYIPITTLGPFPHSEGSVGAPLTVPPTAVAEPTNVLPPATTPVPSTGIEDPLIIDPPIPLPLL